MPKLPERQEYFVKGKDIITDPNAPTVENEFVDTRPEGKYQGATLQVQSKTTLEQDLGTGEAVIMRSYSFATNPEFLQPNVKWPSNQEIFQSHMKGIAGMLWSDGMTPATEIEPRLIFTPDRKSYLIIVWARPSLGQTLLDKTTTLSEIAHGNRKDRDTIQRSVPISSTKKTQTSRATKTSK